MKPAWFFIGNVKIRTLFLVQLSDNIVHERDLLLVNNLWKGFYPEYTEPLVDWFMREFRPASFRPDKAKNLEAVFLYKLHGIGGGEWTTVVENGHCNVEEGNLSKPDVTIEADTEDLVTASLARTKPLVGKFARGIEWCLNSKRREDFVASVAGYYSLFASLIRKRIRISGDRAKMKKLSKAFWHFGQRTKQSEFNILR